MHFLYGGRQVTTPTMRFVQIKSVEQQGQLMLHRARDLLMRQRTRLINALRAHMAELGIVAAQGREGVKELLKIIASEQDARLPVDAHASLVVLAAGLQAWACRQRSRSRYSIRVGGCLPCAATATL
jgi:transposase